MQEQYGQQNNVQACFQFPCTMVRPVVSKHFKVDVELGRVGVATKDRTSQLGGSDGMLPENFGLV
jgi:hypothetical protein